MRRGHDDNPPLQSSATRQDTENACADRLILNKLAHEFRVCHRLCMKVHACLGIDRGEEIKIMRLVIDSGEKVVDGRTIKYEIKCGFYKWKLEYKATVWDIETNLSAKGGGTKDEHTTLDRAIKNLLNLLEKEGHLNPAPLKQEPPPPLKPSSPVAAEPQISVTPMTAVHVSEPAENTPAASNALDPSSAQYTGLLMLTTTIIGLGLLIIVVFYVGKSYNVTGKLKKKRALKPLSTCTKQKSINLHSEPDSPMLNDIVGSHIHPDWYIFATQLEVPYATIKGIKRDENDTKHCFVKIIDHWKSSPSSDKPYTWNTVVTVLESPYINNKKLANEVRSLCTT